VAGDPRQDLELLRKPLEVIARGRRISQSWMDETICEIAEAVVG
jgi:hypothetical protein